MKLWQRYVVMLVIVGLFITLLLTQSGRDTPYAQRIRRDNIVPFIEAQLYGVVTKVRRTDTDLANLVYGAKGKQFYYFDFNDNYEKRYTINVDEGIQVGDTVWKRAGENRFHWSRRGRYHNSYPIDYKHP